MEFDRDLDVKGLNCPLPILRTKKTLAEMETGQILRVQATDSGAGGIVSHLLTTKPPSGATHWSDMLSLMQSTWLSVDHCTEIGDSGWAAAKTIHFAYGACHKYRPRCFHSPA